MPPGIGMMNQMGFGIEILYSFVIIACSLMIYYGTRELYELSSYKGIKYFRKAFLFFAIAYFFRSFIKFIINYFSVSRIMDFAPREFGILTLFAFMYFSSMAIFYLLYSVIWKKLDRQPNGIYLFHVFALIIAFISIILPTVGTYLILNLILLVFAIFTVYISKQNISKKSRGSGLYVIYILLSVFWIFNILDILVPSFVQQFQLAIYLISSGIFLTILYKVIKQTGPN